MRHIDLKQKLEKYIVRENKTLKEYPCHVESNGDDGVGVTVALSRRRGVAVVMSLGGGGNSLIEYLCFFGVFDFVLCCVAGSVCLDVERKWM